MYITPSTAPLSRPLPQPPQQPIPFSPQQPAPYPAAPYSAPSTQPVPAQAPWRIPAEVPDGQILAAENEQTRAKSDRKRIAIAIAAGAILFIILLAIGFNMLRSAVEVVKPPQRVDLIAVSQYSKTRQRQMLLGVLAQQAALSNPNYQFSKGDLMRAGAHAGIFMDGWGNEFQLQDSLIMSAGADGKFDTPDDCWLDARSMEPGGYFPDLEAAIQQMPIPPEARAMLERSRRMKGEIEHNREQFMRSMDAMMKEAESPDFHQGSTVWSDTYRAVEAPPPEPELEYPQAGS